MVLFFFFFESDSCELCNACKDARGQGRLVEDKTENIFAQGHHRQQSIIVDPKLLNHIVEGGRDNDK